MNIKDALVAVSNGSTVYSRSNDTYLYYTLIGIHTYSDADDNRSPWKGDYEDVIAEDWEIID